MSCRDPIRSPKISLMVIVLCEYIYNLSTEWRRRSRRYLRNVKKIEIFTVLSDKWKTVPEDPRTMSRLIILSPWDDRGIIAVTRIFSSHWRLMLLSVLIGCNIIGVVQCSETNNNYASPDHQQQQQQNGKESRTFGSTICSTICQGVTFAFSISSASSHPAI